ncbi:MAG: hypothetical protein ACI9N9_000300 [Enterobacterales bacterium]|jgi:hypothetical protein
MPSIPFIKGDKVDDNTDFRDALPVNYYAVLRDIYGEQGYMLNYYGLSDFATGQGVSRGSIWVERTGFSGQYRVSGTSLIKIEDDQSVTVLGTITGSDQASMTYSLNNLAVVASGRLYYYNPTDGFRQITDSAVGSPIDIVWADFRFVLTDGEYLFQSSLLDEAEYEPLDFSGSDFQPDKIWGVGLNDDNELISFGALTTEYSVNIGQDNFSYKRIQQKAVKAGIAGTHCKAEFNDKWYALVRRSNTQYQFNVIRSGSTQTITSREIEKVLTEYTSDELSKTVIEVFTKDSVTWMVAHLPNKTLVYNDTVANSYGVGAAWSIIKTDVYGDKTYRGKDMTFDPRFSKWVIGDKLDSKIGFLDDSVCTHYNEIVEGLLFTPIIPMETLSINEIKFKTIPGISPDNDATVFVSRTDDLRVHSKEHIEQYGASFDYNKNFISRNHGYVRDETAFKIRTASRSRMAFCRFDVDAS